MEIDIQRTKSGELWEPLSLWRERAREVDALLSIGEALSKGYKPKERHWETLAGEVPAAASQRRNEGKRRLLVAYVNQWLRTAGVALGMRTDGSQYEMALEVGNLSGAVGLLLLVETVLERRLISCSGCGEVFNPDKEHRKYCAACKKGGTSHRLAVRRSRAKQAKKL